MRLSLRIILGLLALTVAASASEITIVRTLPEWRSAASFKRVSEYFTGKENPSGTTILRTHPEQRSGFYFLVRAINPGATTATKINLQLVTPSEGKPKTYTFESTLEAGKNIFNIGLTGEDWIDPRANPVAWKIEFLSPDGRVLASDLSYLWENPTGK
jgi:hypothetical protein